MLRSRPTPAPDPAAPGVTGAQGASPTVDDPPRGPSNADLLGPYLLPYIAYVGIAAVAAGLGGALDYALRIVITASLLLYLHNRLQRLTGPRSVTGSIGVGVIGGLLGVVIWIGLVLPFRGATDGEAFGALEFILRLAAASLIVPFVEEFLFRGYLMAFVAQWQHARAAGARRPLSVALDHRSVHDVEPGTWTLLAVIVSAAAFALGHSPFHWLAAFAYGVLMSSLWIVRRDLVAPITAHGVTNLVLYLYVYSTGSWGLW